MLLALVRDVSPAIGNCELTHIDRAPIDVVRAVTQHQAYVGLLQRLGCRVEAVPPAPAFADSVFIEDTAVVLDEIAIITRPGAESRRGETAAVAGALAHYRPIEIIMAPGSLDGGDVLLAGRTLFVGRSGRSNDDGIAQLARCVEPLGYRVEGVELTGCLHLKTAATVVAEGTILVNPAWVTPARFGTMTVIEVPAAEPFGANVVRVGAAVLMADAFPSTGRLLRERGMDVHTVDVSELAKAEGAVTCCSILLEDRVA